MGAIKRLAYEDLDPALKETLRPKVERLGYLGEFFAVGGHQPNSTRLFQEFTESLKAALPSELTEAVALGVASTLDNGYEQAQHEQLASKLGFPDEWIAAAIGRSDQSVMSESARAARSLALTMVASYGRDAADELARAVDVLGEEVAVGVLLTVGRYVAHAVIANTLRLAPPVKTVVPAARAGSAGA